jgi:hypothetical protein
MATTIATSLGPLTVLVVGDLGRSPRMQLHALSLADPELGNAHVELIGEAGIPHMATWCLPARVTGQTLPLPT